MTAAPRRPRPDLSSRTHVPQHFSRCRRARQVCGREGRPRVRGVAENGSPVAVASALAWPGPMLALRRIRVSMPRLAHRAGLRHLLPARGAGLPRTGAGQVPVAASRRRTTLRTCVRDGGPRVRGFPHDGPPVGRPSILTGPVFVRTLRWDRVPLVGCVLGSGLWQPLSATAVAPVPTGSGQIPAKDVFAEIHFLEESNPSSPPRGPRRSRPRRVGGRRRRVERPLRRDRLPLPRFVHRTGPGWPLPCHQRQPLASGGPFLEEERRRVRGRRRGPHQAGPVRVRVRPTWLVVVLQLDSEGRARGGIGGE